MGGRVAYVVPVPLAQGDGGTLELKGAFPCPWLARSLVL